MSPKHGTRPGQAAAAHVFVGQTETFLGFIGRAQAGPLSAKAACAVTDRQQTARENDRNRPHVASCTFVAMDPSFGEAGGHAQEDAGAEAGFAANEGLFHFLPPNVNQCAKTTPSNESIPQSLPIWAHPNFVGQAAARRCFSLRESAQHLTASKGLAHDFN